MSYKREKPMYTVYEHIAPNGKVYVGITMLTIEKRWRNGEGYKSCPLFYKAIKKYGWENIKHRIIAEGVSKEYACQKECELIWEYKRKNMSYNCSDGGELTAKGCVRTDEFKQKISLFNKGKKLSEETKRKLSESHKGKIPTVTQAVIEGRKKTREKLQGRTFTAEHRKKISEAKKGKRTGEESPYNKKILCITNNKTYYAVKEAARELKLDASSICKVCKGKLKHYKGYVFEYVGDTS